MESNVIEVRKAVKTYGADKVLNNLSMSVQSGRIYALLGSSGCGKTTLLSSIVGINNLDSGIIRVFNETVGTNKRKIGFMPQDFSLIDEFTIKELIWFFGTLYGIDREKLLQRLKYLVDLLELKNIKTLVKNCSGGEKRRISLAICMVHQPELLILDEPTVGLDPILRFKIWKFLETITSSGHATVVITTHYIEEAKQAHVVGLLRNGAIISESSPANILSQTKTDLLEEAFIELCKIQDKKGCSSKDFNAGTEKNVDENFRCKSLSPFPINRPSSESFNQKTKKFKALTRKIFMQTIRRPASLGFLVLTPLICLISYFLIIGRDPIGLKIGIINKEVKNISECSNQILLKTSIHDYTCYTTRTSCRFINQISDKFLIKKFYNNSKDAFEDAKHGKIVGFIKFSENFTSFLRPFNEVQDYLLEHVENGEIQVFLDQSDRQITFFLKQNLFKVYENFIENLMKDCGKSKRVGSFPIKIESLFGSFSDEMQRSITPGIIVTLFFFLASMVTSTAFISDRLDGVWNRVLLAGVDPVEVLTSHIISNLFIIFLQTAEFHVVTTYVFELERVGNYWLVMSLLVLVEMSAILYGLAVSIWSNDFMTATFSSTLIFYPMIIMCGIFWPLEAIPWYFRYLAYCLPFSLPTKALRNILYKGYGINHETVQIGFLVIVIWILLALMACFVGIRTKKFFKNSK